MKSKEDKTMEQDFDQDLVDRLNFTGCVINPLENDRYVIITADWRGEHFDCRVMDSENDDDFEVITAKTPEEAIKAHICTLCHVLEGDGSCCGCLEIQRDQGRYEGLWDDDEHPDT